MKIAILMCTYNGEKYISDQLNSILNQSITDWHLYISDDHSSDSTLQIINSWILSNNLLDKVTILSGPGLGFAKNFLYLTANQTIIADLYFWSDQDDIWLPDKLSRAIQLSAKYDNNLPFLYCSRTILVDKDNKEIGLSPLFNKIEPSFNNALLQSLGGANTMAFNNRSRELIILARDYQIPSHDWWSYIIISGNGGNIIYDTSPFLRYRQHNSNLIGTNKNILAKLKRFIQLFNGTYNDKIEGNLEVLVDNNKSLTNKNQEILTRYIYLKKSNNIFKKFVKFRSLSLCRQSRLQTWIFNIAFAVNKV